MYTLNKCQKIIESQISKTELPESPFLLYEPIRYTMNSAGKRIRPALTLLACNLFTDSIDNAIYPALAIEIFHNFTLLHDDIMDRSEENVAILSGDTMLIKAYQYLSKSPQNILPKIFELFNETAIGVCEGQQYDMDFESQKNVQVDNYLKMIELKTAVLIAASLKIGSICGGADDKDSDLLYEFGKNLGIAFQLQDDLLDVYADQEVFGKATGGDIVANKKTFLLINALTKAKDKTLEELQKWHSMKEFDKEEKIKQIISIYNQLNIKELTEQKISEFYLQAISSFERISVKKERKEILQQFAAALMEREK